MSDIVEPRHDQAPAVERRDPPLRSGEAEMLVAFLDYHRDTLRMKVAALDPDQLDRTLPPSTMTLGGLVSHMTLVEDQWFSVVLEGNPPAPPWDDVDWDADNDWDWHRASGMDLDALLPEYDEAVRRSDRAITEALDREGPETPSAKPSRRGEGAFSLRWILLHMIEEYARHNGHADLIRESIDGQVGD
jgi:uncharacterized damage-inducible protein DinB